MNRHKHSIWKTIGLCAVFLLAYSISVLVGYGMTSLTYRFMGKPPEVIVYLLSAIIGILFFVLLFTTLRFTALKHHTYDIHRSQNNLFDALEQISRGNFEVLLDPRALGNFYELAEAVNQMAHNLGTLETMRQDFISNVSHEIQSPLTSIGGFAKLLRNEDLSNEERNHYAEIIEAESNRLSSLSENLLKLSSLDQIPLNETEFRLDKQLEQIALLLEPQWSANDIIFEADLQKGIVTADKDLLSQVWVNLLFNGIKFTPEGGTVTIALHDHVVTIADTGIGIPDEDKIHVFERFYKVDKARDRASGGNGLGLSLVKKIIQLHGGEVSVADNPGGGTIFTVTLPRLHSV